MRRKPIVLLPLLATLLLLTAASPALSDPPACTAGNPSASVIQTTPTSDFTVNPDGTVTHAKTGLMWKQCAEGLSSAGCAAGAATAMAWAGALNAAKAANVANGGLGFAGYTDWRLPNQKELESIIEYCGYNPSINQMAFPATPALPFWSASSYVFGPTNAWVVDFGLGSSEGNNKTFSSYARLVRGGQPVDSFDALNPPPPTMPVLQSAASRKVHSGAGTFNLPLSAVATNPTTEPRQGPAQTIVFTFDKPISAAASSITEGAATAAAPTFSGNDVVVELTGVNNQQYVTIALTNVASTDGGTGGSGAVRLGFLLGDVNQNRVVTVADLGLVNAQLAQVVTAANFLKDVNTSGTLTVADKAITNANLTKALPTP